MTTLVLGSNGQVGSHLRRLLSPATFWDRSHLDLRDVGLIENAIIRASPSKIVNAAAFTAVDRAESECQTAWAVNSTAAAAVASAAAVLEVPLVYISTDYVFDGESSTAYREHDGVRPVNVYGMTKLGGELAVASICDRCWILRTSWVFSEYGSNFVKTMIRLGAERPDLKVVRDQRGRPSYAGDVASIIVRLLEAVDDRDGPPPGTYHIGGGPATTWYEFANTIFDHAIGKTLLKSRPTVEAITSNEFPAVARRPRNSTLQPNEGFQTALNVAPNWLSGLTTTLRQLTNHS